MRVHGHAVCFSWGCKRPNKEGRRRTDGKKEGDPQEALLMGMVGCWAEEKFRMIKMEKDKPEGEGSTHC